MNSRNYDYSLHYKIYHDESDEHLEMMVRYYEGLLKPFLPPPGPHAVLDIGCGMGFAMLAMKKMGFLNLRGIEIDDEQVKYCKFRNLPVEKVDDSIQFLEQHAGKFDIVLMLDVLEHIPVPIQIEFMRVVYNSMKPSGRVILTVPNASSICAFRWRYIDYTHHSSFTEISLKFILKNAGFDKVTILGQAPMTRPSFRLWRRSARMALIKWVIRYIWRLVFMVENPGYKNINDVSFELNLIAVAYK